MRMRGVVAEKLSIPASLSRQTSDSNKSGGLRPPLKWAGGKRWQVPHLRPLWAAHTHRRLVEPFCGGLAVTLGISPQRALLNDINPHVVNFYSWLKRGLRTSLLMNNSERQYYAHRERFNQLLTDGKATRPGSGGAFLLPQSDRLQRALADKAKSNKRQPVVCLVASRPGKECGAELRNRVFVQRDSDEPK